MYLNSINKVWINGAQLSSADTQISFFCFDHSALIVITLMQTLFKEDTYLAMYMFTKKVNLSWDHQTKENKEETCFVIKKLSSAHHTDSIFFQISSFLIFRLIIVMRWSVGTCNIQRFKQVLTSPRCVNSFQEASTGVNDHRFKVNMRYINFLSI